MASINIYRTVKADRRTKQPKFLMVNGKRYNYMWGTPHLSNLESEIPVQRRRYFIKIVKWTVSDKKKTYRPSYLVYVRLKVGGKG